MTLNGTLGTATMKNSIDNTNIELFVAGDVKLSANVITAKTKHVGNIVSQPKAMGVELSGSASLFAGTPQYTAMISTFINTGVFPMFSIQIDNEDTGANLSPVIANSLPVGVGGIGGVQHVTMTGCVLDGEHVIAQLSTGTEPLKIDIKWVGTGLDVSTPFGHASLVDALLAAASGVLTSSMLGGLFAAGQSLIK
jgi:hypothetical protein